MRRLSRRYIAGDEREDALRRGAELASSGYRITYDQLGEAVTNLAEVEAAVAENLNLLTDLREQGLERNISTKPTQMGIELDEQACLTSLRKVLEQAKADDAFLRFEMEESWTVDATLRVFETLRQEYPSSIGIVLQSMLFRTEKDVEELLRLSSGELNVRLVKGIYVESPEVAYQDPLEVSESYRRCLRMLLEGGAFVAAATHDEKLIATLQELIGERPEWANRCEVQMLLGVREELRQQVRAAGLPVRVYVPYGDAWHKYVVRRLKKNPKLARYAFLGMFGKSERLG